MQETEDIVSMPCPFCGDSDIYLDHDQGAWPMMRCQGCGATGPCVNTEPSLARKAWNTQPTIATLRAEVEGLRWRSVEDELPPMNTEVLVAFDTRPLPATAQLTMHKGMRQWLWPAENDATEGEEPVSVTHWMPLPDHPNEQRFAAIDAAKADKEGA